MPKECLQEAFLIWIILKGDGWIDVNEINVLMTSGLAVRARGEAV